MDDIGLYQEPSQAGVRSRMITRANDLSARYQSVRQATEALASGLTEEDQCVQSMPDASPAKLHRAHTTWFF